MPLLPITLIKGDEHGSETDYRDALHVNMYAVPRKVHSADGYLLNYPGLSSFGTGFGIDRGGVYNERLIDHYRVSGTKFISVSKTGVVVELGPVSGNRQAALPYSFNTQAVIANYNMWLYDGTTFTRIIDPDLGKPIDCVWVDGYYFLTDGEYLYHTDITDEYSIDPLNYATAEFMPDPSLGLSKTQDNKVMVFGRYSLEYFVNDSTDNFAFTRVETRAQKIGIVATHAKCETGTAFYITGGRRNEAVTVYRVSIGSSEKISTREVDKIIAKYSEPDLIDMRMESRLEDDITFVLVHLPNETLCFNETVARAFGVEAAWSILKTDVKGDITYRAINGIFDSRTSKWIYGDKWESIIGVLDNDVTTHYSVLVEWLLYSPFVNLEKASIDELEIETIPGFTITEDATVAFSLTYNGVTYGQEYWMDYGSPNDFNTRFIVRRLGYINQWFGLKFRGVSKSKMAFSLMKITYA
jgi:hypothetical protein